MINNFHYHNPCDIYMGDDVLNKLPELIGDRRVLLITGGMATRASGIVDDVGSILTENDIEWVELGGSSVPAYERVLSALRVCNEADIGCVIGIGGCSCMDLAKIIAFGACNEEDLWDYLSGKKELRGDEDHLQIGVIPTYPSGGSEADSAAEVDDLESGDHGSLYGIFPDFSLLNPEYTYTLNKEQTAYAAAVTFVQVSVNYLGDYSPIAEGMTKSVLKELMKSTAVAMRDPRNYDARATQMRASALSSMGILSCGKGDSWSWDIYSDMDPITKVMDLSYRQAITILFPRWLVAQAQYHGDDVRRYMVDIMGVDPLLPIEEAVLEGAEKIIDYFISLGLPMNYGSVGILPDADDLREAIEECVAEEEEALAAEDEEDGADATDAADEDEDEDDLLGLSVEERLAMFTSCY